MFTEFFHQWQSTLDWQPDSDQSLRFEKLYDLVVAGNKTQNLTRILTIPDFWEKHLWDSLRGILPLWTQAQLQVIDIGAGAGFPGIPVAIAHPDWQLTLLDSTHKKTAFIDHCAESIPITNVKSLTGRAEHLNHTKPYFQSYDLALIRAVGGVELCTEYALPFLKPKGILILYRGQWSESDRHNLGRCCQIFDAEIHHIDHFVTPLSASMRNCVHILKY